MSNFFYTVEELINALKTLEPNASISDIEFTRYEDWSIELYYKGKIVKKS